MDEDMFEGVMLGVHLPAGWLWGGLVFFGLILGAGLLVLLLVSGARFDEQSPAVSPTPGPCAPFCISSTPPTPSYPQ
ncbi:hypothetical protein [Nocardia sp. NPDC020380]|uniref:hypothetical protein n=1 Tax=Nocardia sp. NPDC020380 TaxID=3364309 RepID=UPI0037A2148E